MTSNYFVKQNKKTAKQQPDTLTIFSNWIALLPFALPLLYTQPLVGNFKNELLRSALVICAGLMSYIIIVTRKLYATLPLKLVGALVLLMILSLLRTANVADSLVGRYGDYQGLLLQLSALTVAIVATSRVRDKKYWRQVTMVMQIVCFISLFINRTIVLHGYRLSGLLLHDTGMGLYAGVAFGLTLLMVLKGSEKRKVAWHQWATISLLSLIVILSASRLAMILVALLVLVYAVALPVMRKKLLVFTLVFMALFSIATLSLPATGRLDNTHKLQDGTSYRYTLYRWSIKHADLSLVGPGEVDIMAKLRPHFQEKVPPVLYNTFYVGYPLWYSHCQWIDIWIAYGILGFMTFAGLCGLAVSRLSRAVKNAKLADRYELLAVCTLLIAMLLHLSFNTPSIELWPLVWLSLCAALKKNPALK